MSRPDQLRTLDEMPGISYKGDLSVFNGALDELRFFYGENAQITFTHLAEKHSSPVVEVVTPFVFDRRRLPRQYRGLYFEHHFSDSGELPADDPKDRFTPRWMETYVDSQLVQIRRTLENPEMTREEALDALSAGMRYDIDNFADLQRVSMELPKR
jgi:hypothetical protein